MLRTAIVLAILLVGCKLKPSKPAAKPVVATESNQVVVGNTEAALLCKEEDAFNLDTLKLYRDTVFPEVIQPNCMSCHVQDGLAAQAGSGFILNSAQTSDSLYSMSEYIDEVVPSASRLMKKATLNVPHHEFTTPLIERGSEEYSQLLELVNRLAGDREKSLACAASALQDKCFVSRSFDQIKADFMDNVYTPLIKPHCSGCHSPGGFAENSGAGFVMEQATNDQATLTNIKTLMRFSNTEQPEASLFVEKASLAKPHGFFNEALLPSSDPLLKETLAFIERFASENQPQCLMAIDPLSLGLAGEIEQGIGYIDNSGALRRMTILFGGRFPTSAEVDQVQENGEAEILAILDRLMDESIFYSNIRTAFNEHFNLEAFGVRLDQDTAVRAADSRLINIENSLQRPETLTVGSDNDSSIKSATLSGLDLVEYIVANNRPLSELVTADYRVVSSAHSKFWQINFSGDGDFDIASPDYTPLAGILTDYWFLNRYPNSGINGNRHRASKTLLKFLGTDGESISKSSRIEDDDVVGGDFNVATRDNPNCYVCHQVLDPIGGLFQHWGGHVNDQYTNGIYQKNGENTGFLEPGFRGEKWPGDIPKIVWLGKKIAQDERFPRTMVKVIIEKLLRWQLLDQDHSNSSSSHAAVFSFQRKYIDDYTRYFVQSGMVVKELLRYIVLSKPFRYRDMDKSMSEKLRADRVGLGLNSVYDEFTMARLAGKIGLRGAGFMEQRLLYGAPDHISKLKRNHALTSGMERLNTTFANNMCSVSKGNLEQLLDAQFTLDFKDLGTSDKPNEKIMAGIERLHYLLWGEIDKEESSFTYELISQVYNSGAKECTNREVTAWNAVLGYLARDIQFIRN